MSKRSHGMEAVSDAVPADRMQLLCIIGPPGAGKTTQAAALARATGRVHVSAGDLVREAREAGERVPRDVHDRSLADPRWIVDRIRIAAGDASELILDGFPRHEAHIGLLPRVGHCRAMIRLCLPYEAALERMMARNREGEDLARIGSRRFLYEKREAELLAGVVRAGIQILDMDGSREQDAITADLAAALTSLDVAGVRAG